MYNNGRIATTKRRNQNILNDLRVLQTINALVQKEMHALIPHCNIESRTSRTYFAPMGIHSSYNTVVMSVLIGF